jgi:hypothetical protein
MKKITWLLLISLTTFSFSQINLDFSKYGKFRWDLSFDHVIVKLNPGFTKFQLETKLKEINGKVVNQLNNNNFYLVNFRNRSKTEIIFERQLTKMKTITFIQTIIPVMKFNDKLTNLDIYENSSISGFSTLKNDSLFAENLNLRGHFVSCYNKEFRNQPKFVRYIYTNFQIVNGQTKNLRILETDMEEEYLGCIKRVINKQDWKNEKFNGQVSFFYIVYLDQNR